MAGRAWTLRDPQDGREGMNTEKPQDGTEGMDTERPPGWHRGQGH